MFQIKSLKNFYQPSNYPNIHKQVLDITVELSVMTEQIVAIN